MKICPNGFPGLDKNCQMADPNLKKWLIYPPWHIISCTFAGLSAIALAKADLNFQKTQNQ